MKKNESLLCFVTFFHKTDCLANDVKIQTNHLYYVIAFRSLFLILIIKYKLSEKLRLSLIFIILNNPK